MRNSILLLLCFSSSLFAQNNASQQIVYFDDGFNVCEKDYAYYAGILIPKEDQTDVIIYHFNGKHAFTGSYLDKTLQKRNGTFTWFDTTGVRIAVAEYKNNVQDGVYFFWYSNSVLRDSGQYKDGTPDGLWKSWYPNRQLKMICAYDAKALADYRKSYVQNNAGVELMKLAKPEKLSNLARVEPEQDVSPRLRRSYMNNLREKENQFNTIINAAADAPYNTSSENDQHIFFSHIIIRYDLISPSAVLLNGSYYTFYPNGQPKESGTYKEGHKTGFWETWYENGKRQSVGRYNKNHEVQEWKYYDDSGELKLIRRFKKDGRLIDEIKM